MLPVGTAKWFKLHKADEKYGKYSVDLVVEDSEEFQEFKRYLEDLVEEALEEEIEKLKEAGKTAAAKKVVKSQFFPIEEETNKEGIETGKFVIRIRQPSTGKRKDGSVFEYAPPVLLSVDKKILSKDDKNTLDVPNGSEIKVKVELRTYVSTLGVGVSIRPNACQIISTKPSFNADITGFEDLSDEDIEDSEAEEFIQDAEGDF